MDGVRQGEPFAGTINWEAIPDFAVRNVEMIPVNTLRGTPGMRSPLRTWIAPPSSALELS